MARTLSQILTDVNAVLDLEATLPTGDELVTRTNYANQAVWDASATGQLSEFKREYVTAVGTSATVSLPSDFRELMVDPQVLDSTGNWQEYEVIEAEERYEKSTNEKYAYVMGDPAAGYNLIFNQLISGATLSAVYQRFPSGLATLTDVCELSDPQVVARQTEQYVLYSRSDDRFPIAEQKAQRQLSNLMGREMKGSSGQSRDTKMKFRNPLQNRA